MAKRKATRKRGKAPVTAKKAKKILADGEVKGHPLTEKQKRFFGLIAGGGTPTRTKKKKRKRSK